MTRRTLNEWLKCLWCLSLLTSPLLAHAAPPIGQCGTCATSFECAEGLNCISARCKSMEQCCLDQDCPSGQSCQDHQCRASGSSVGECGECATSFQCSNDLNCIGARCKDTDQCCFDQDCPTGQRCQDHQCKITSANVSQCGECVTSFQCANDLNCIGARCKDTDQCCFDQDCPGGQSCQQNHCKRAID